MKILKAALVTTIALVSIALTSCVSLITGTAMAASMSAGVEKTNVDKTNSNLVTVHVPIAKVPNSAMLYFSKDTPVSGGEATYTIHIRYTSSISMNQYESLRFEIDGVKTDLKQGLASGSTDVASSMLQGFVYDYNYTTETGQIASISIAVDPTIAKNLISSITTGKSVVVKNYQKASTNFISYTLTPADQLLFKNLF